MRIELEKKVPIFSASEAVQVRIEVLLVQQESPLSAKEERELHCYEEIDRYLSFVNQTVRNAIPELH